MSEREQFETVSVEATSTRVVRVRVRGAEAVTPQFLDGALAPTEVRLACVQHGDSPWQVRDVEIMGSFTPRHSGSRRVHTETYSAAEAPASLPAWVLNLASKYLPKTDSGQGTRDDAWDVISEVRDRYPRLDNDAPTDGIVEALAEAGLLSGGDAPPMSLSLVHHLYDGRKETSADDYAAGWSTTDVPDAPEVTQAMEAALRPRVTDLTSKGRNVTWWHCDSGAWAAVTDLHRAGEHEDALGLARFLRWCDQRFNGRVQGFWEIERGDLGREPR